MTARILLQGPTAGRLRFQPSRSAPSLPHQVPNEHAENTGTRKRRHPEAASALDPLENTIRRLRPLITECPAVPRMCSRIVPGIIDSSQLRLRVNPRVEWEFCVPTVRPYWKGYIKLALVSCPIALYTASSSSERVAFR